jgi:hypothetical protein
MDPVAIVADVTEMETRPPAQPANVEALEARGFRVLGRFATLSGPSRYDNAYSRPERARLEAWRNRPAATVLVAPDGTAFAGVDTFGEAPLLRLRTELDDGTVVETIGTERRGALVPRRGDPFAGFSGTATPDHPVRLIEDPSPDAVIAAHHEHVAEVVGRLDAQPLRHADRDHALRLATKAADQMTRIRDRTAALIRRTVLVVVIPIGLLWLWVELSSGMSVGSALLMDLLLIPVVLLVVLLVLLVVGRSPRRRPPLNPSTGRR